MTLTGEGRDRPYECRSGIVSLLTSKIHVDPLTAVREMTANSRDEYSILPGVDPKILIEIDAEKRRFIHTDFAGGIKDIDDFCLVGNENIEGIGKKVGNRVNSPDKIDPDIGGQYHIAKMSYVDCSDAQEDKVRLYSNNGTYGDILTMRQYGWGDPEHFRGQNRTIAKPESGLKIEVLNARESLLKVRRVLSFLEEKVGILTARGKLNIEIIERPYDGNPQRVFTVGKPKWLKIDNEITKDPLLKLKSGNYITCRLEHTAKASNQNNIYIFVKYIGICAIHVNYLVSGWINCDELTNAIDLSRDRLISSSAITKEVLEKLNNYLDKKGFVKQTHGNDDSFKPTKQMNEIATLALKTLRIQLENLSGDPDETPSEGAMDKKGEKVAIEVEKEKREIRGGPPKIRPPPGPPTGIVRTPRTTRKVTKWVDSQERQPNVTIIPRKEGQQKPTMFYNIDNLEELILNVDQDDAQMITRVSKPTALITAIPLIAEAGVDLMTREVSLTAEAWKEEYRKLRLILWESS